MIGRLRLAITLAVFVIATPPLALYQFVVTRTGLGAPATAPRAWFRLMTRLLGIRVRSFGTLSSDRPLLLVANHVSWTDIMVLGSLADVHFIAKSEVAGWPVFGLLARLGGTVFVERAARRATAGQARLIAERLGRGTPLVLFAEGTSSDGNGVLPFKTSLFAGAQLALAQAENPTASIQPVAIAYTRLQGLPMGRLHRPHIAWIGDQTLLPHLSALLSEGAMDVEVHFGAPVALAAGGSRKDIARQLEAEVRRMMAEALRRPSPLG